MKLKDLLMYDKIVIQCHDNPDADAIASGYGILVYLQAHRKNVRLVYSGDNLIKKSNLVLMIDRLSIPIEHVESLETIPDLLLTVDCQYGTGNVTKLPGNTIAVIDHHQVEGQLPDLCEIRNYGSCSTIIWDMLVEAQNDEEKQGNKILDINNNKNLSTALYYGLYMDTGEMQEHRHPKDKDLQDTKFKCNEVVLFELQNCNLSLEEIMIAGEALISFDYYEDGQFAIVETKRCDPNILGIIGDMVIKVDSIHICVVYSILESGAKLSVRTCVKETMADDLVKYITDGAGGGHTRKAGGKIPIERLIQTCKSRFHLSSISTKQLGSWTNKLLAERINDYFQNQDLIYAGTDQVPDLSQEPCYQKKRLPIGYIPGTDLYPAGTKVMIRMLEGDATLTIAEDTYFIIGMESEVYQNKASYFFDHNDPIDETYQFHGQYAPKIRGAIQSKEAETETKDLTLYAKSCIPKDSSFIHARTITRRTKVFVSWIEDGYLLGQPGDILASRKENPLDVYIIKKHIFEKTYEPV